MRNILLIACLFVSCQAFAQELGRNNMGFYVGFGNTRIMQSSLVGAPSYDAKNSFLFGLSYTRYLNRKLAIETAASYLDTNVEMTPAFDPSSSMSRNSVTLPLEMVTFRAGLKYSFLQYLFVNGGLLFDFDVENEIVDPQSGIGLGIGLGAEYVFPSGFNMFANPYLNQHALIPFQREDSPQRLLDGGIRLGVGYRFQ